MRKRSQLAIEIIGMGRMGMQHLKSIRGLRNAEIAGIAEPRANGEKIKEIIGQDPKIYPSAEELFKTERPDLVHVVTALGTHYEYGRMGL